MRFFLKNVSGFSRSSVRSSNTQIGRVKRALRNHFVSRRLLKRQVRQTWISQANALARRYNMPYSRFLYLLRQNNILLNKKMISYMGNAENLSFGSLLVVCSKKT
uniref:Ribosomal protein L20 n=1 Tax=Ophirina amphinema TaxID=2108040 RepID=A0A348AYS4_9EUKA|nr:ribosomal protein L20 [Ophirina amphinema]